MITTITDSAKFYFENNNFAVGIHANPDGDCFGSAIALCGALKKMKKNCVILSPSPLPKRLFFLNYDNIPVYVGKDGYEELKSIWGENITLTTVDVASDHLLGELSTIFENKNEFAVDHHENGTISSKRICLDKNASAAGEIVYKIILELEEMSKMPLLDENTASAVFGAICSDSGCFKYSNVTAETHIIASELIKKGINHANIAYRLFDLKSPVQIAVESLSYSKLEYYFEGKLSFIYLSNDELSEIGAAPSDTETVAQLGRGIEGVQIAAYMRKKSDGVFKISVRSNNDADMSVLCSGLGNGGGHKKAAGCSVCCDDAEKAKMIFLERAKDFLE